MKGSTLYHRHDASFGKGARTAEALSNVVHHCPGSGFWLRLDQPDTEQNFVAEGRRRDHGIVCLVFLG
jgi:hypothetical protein